MEKNIEKTRTGVNRQQAQGAPIFERDILAKDIFSVVS
jgi:hypothetical protein